MENIYSPKKIEFLIKEIWNKYNNLNKFVNNKINYSILLPPPNITGDIHIGHSLQYIIIDFYLRYNSMLNKNTFAIFGLDHAGIATQLLIEKKYNYNLVENAFLLKKNIKKKISKQIKKLGLLLKNNKIRFTLDNHYKYSVNYIFSNLYYNGIIYKSNKIVNWDTKLNSAISDLEIINKTILSNVWYIKYFFLNKNIKEKFILIATTRPETIFGDSAIAIDKNDNRYNKFIGEEVIVPIVNRIIKIIYDDEYVDYKNETGCVKITPANSFIDYEIAKKNNLYIIKTFNYNGYIKDNFEIYQYNNINNIKYESCPKDFTKLNILQLKEKIIFFLNKYNYIYLEKQKYINIKYSDRTLTKIEPMITEQWFLNLTSISNQATNIIKNKKILFFPKKYEKIYINWIKNVKDWCISRQIWWGHKIPIWYDDVNNKIYSGINEKIVRKKFNINKNIKLRQDNSVLDTWFSSSIWSFVSLGWPSNINNFLKFYPYNLVVSGFDIIFFWISKMIILSLYVFKDNDFLKIPFKNIYITGLIKDEYGNKMSKSRNNVLNPIEIINNKKNYLGIDSLRMTLLSITNKDKYISFNKEKILLYKKFCNKLWNLSIYIINNINGFEYNEYDKYIKNKEILNYISIFDKWILIKLEILIQESSLLINKYRLDILIKKIYDFIKVDVSNIYITFFIKNIFITKYNSMFLLYLIENIIKFLHPIIPFITEKIWIILIDKFKLEIKNNLLINNTFPYIYFNIINNNYFYYYEKINLLINVIKKIKTYKNKYIIIFKNKDDIEYIEKYIFLLYNIFKNKNIILKLDINITTNFIII